MSENPNCGYVGLYIPDPEAERKMLGFVDEVWVFGCRSGFKLGRVESFFFN